METAPEDLAEPGYNAAADLIGRNLAQRRGERVAFRDEAGSHRYSAVAERAARCADALLTLDLQPGDRIVLCLLDSVDFPTCFLGAIAAGIVPVPVNTLFPPQDYAFILSDSGARAAIVSEPLLAQMRAAAAMAGWAGRLIVAGQPGGGGPSLSELLDQADPAPRFRPAAPDAPCFWLYSSGSTGKPKGAIHRQGSLIRTAELFGQGILGLHADDLVYSAAKLFFAYGLGNALTFPMAVGAASILEPGRPTPELVIRTLTENPVTVFCGVPTLYASLLASPDFPARGALSLRLCTSAGEPLPAEIGRAWTERTGVEIIDGIGSTEMLHIFLSNRPGAVRYGTTGHPVPGYEARLVGETGGPAAAGEIGALEVRGPTAARGYWNNPDKTAATFAGGWVRTGDKFRQDETGAFVYCGRSDDMLKVGGIWVSPAEIEAALMTHPAVLEAAVIGKADAGGLVKPKAFVVLKDPVHAHPDLAAELGAFVKTRLAPYKYPRWVSFLDALPKTATGKIRRHVLREQEASATDTVAAAGA